MSLEGEYYKIACDIRKILLRITLTKELHNMDITKLSSLADRIDAVTASLVAEEGGESGSTAAAVAAAQAADQAQLDAEVTVLDAKITALEAAAKPAPTPPAALAVDATALAAGTTGSPYTGALTATGGTAPYAWSVTSGALPDGLSMGSDGTLTGTPGTGGTFSFVVAVSDSSSPVATASSSESIVVA